VLVGQYRRDHQGRLGREIEPGRKELFDDTIGIGIVEQSSNAGERTRTSKGRSPTGPKPAASTSSATPAKVG
jgi:hypothetical protein